MDTTEFRPQLHIAQQSRRDKLRIQQDFTFPHHNNEFYDYDSSAAAGDIRNCRSGSICYDPSEICSEMINFSAKRGGEPPPPPPFQAFPRDNPPSFNASDASAAAAASTDPRFFNTWKSVGLQPTSDWAANHGSVLDAKPSYLEYPDIMNGDSPVYRTSLIEFVNGQFVPVRQKNDSGHGPWAAGAYADQWGGGEELDRGPTMAANDHSRALSLSLSSVPSPKVHQILSTEKDFPPRDVHHDQDSRNWNPSQNLPAGGRLMVPQASTHRNPGPLGPFTGYSTILRSSKFLRPAQQLLEELCCISRRKTAGIRDISDEIMEDARVSNEVVSDVENSNAVRGGGGSTSFVFDGDKGREAGGMNCPTDACGSENFQRKAKLLFMQDEVWKRSKQYHQQMQMVVSSFETVAGLDAATPYVSLALKAISKHFRSLKNAITDQIKSIRNSLGEEFSSPPSGGASKGEANASMLKFFDQTFQKQKGSSSSDNLGILEGQHIWRPQRGLPERAVSILRAWLFDHFLHPYPTDTDKHMLATQTGLTRNQVSNWFINARVRVWKPMVEEIHMLDTKGSSDNGKTAAEGDGYSTRARMCLNKQVESSGEEEAENRASSSCVWNQEKRSRIEYDGSLMGVVGHRSGAVEMGGMGAVSLTLGLRQSAENAQQLQERNLRCYGGQILRDFVG